MIKVLTKVLPRLEHHVGIVNGFSKEKCGGKNDLLGVTGQGNMFLGAACRDVSFIIFR